MSEIKHTPGPFIYTYNKNAHYHDGEVLDMDGNLLAIVSGSNYGMTFGGKNRDWGKDYEQEDLQEHIANAKLFAASPKLLAALIEARTFVCGWHAMNPSEETEKVLSMCNEAIKEANE